MQYAEIFLDLQQAGGAVAGDSQAHDYEGQIELFDWSWGVKLEEAASDAAVSSTKQAVGRSIAISKPVDSASTTMMTLLENGTRLPSAVLTLVQRTQKNLMVRLELKGVLLMSYDLEVESDDSEVSLSEEWTLTYDEISIQYKAASGTGDARGKAPSLGATKFVLPTPRNTTMEAPVRQPRVETATKGGGDLDKNEVFKLIDEYLKKHKIGK